MITLDAVCRMVLTPPETGEGTHFRMPAFQVHGRST
jgi:hypothetical protein